MRYIKVAKTVPKKILKGEYFKDLRRKFAYKHEPSEEQFEEIMDLFFKKLSYYITNTSGGVFLDKVGYFFIFMTPKKRAYLNGENTDFNYETNGYRYTPMFFPCVRNSVAKHWMMDYRFKKELKADLKDKLLDGYRYLNFTSIFDTRNRFKLDINKGKRELPDEI